MRISNLIEPAPAVQTSPTRILIVDDDPDSLSFLKNVLKNEGYRLTTASGGQEGVELARQDRPDLILLDVLMPDMDGFAVCEQLKAERRTKRIPIIFLTGDDDRESVIKAFQLGAVDYITKPFDYQELRVRVRNHASLARVTNKLRVAVSKRTRQLNDANDRLRRLASQLVLAGEQERRTLAGELHDSTIHKLALVETNLQAIDCANRSASQTFLKSSVALVEDCIKELRTLIFDLSPPVLYDLGLDAALEWLAQQVNQGGELAFDYESDGDLPDLEEDQQILLFQSVRELVVNVERHAVASRGWITVETDASSLAVTVSDDGEGFDTTMRTGEAGGYGLFSVRQRMELLGGQLVIESGRQGTRAQLFLPLNVQDVSDK